MRAQTTTRRTLSDWIIAFDEAVERVLNVLHPGLKERITLSARRFRPSQAALPERYISKLYSLEDSNQIIAQAITGEFPFVVSRFGAYELMACAYYWRKSKGCGSMPRVDNWPPKISTFLFTNAGVFPQEGQIIDRFSSCYLSEASEINYLAYWFRPDEHLIHKYFCPSSKLLAFDSLTPFMLKDPWTKKLKNMRVLVIHPFEKSIRAQYQKRKFLFQDEDVIPEFELLTYPAIQAIGGRGSRFFKDWFQALDKMKTDLSYLNFDIALIGAGAFGLPLAVHVKRMGRKAIHIGGALQLFFGIKGKRWESRQGYPAIFNTHWCRPFEEETPKEAEMVEDGCYW